MIGSEEKTVIRGSITPVAAAQRRRRAWPLQRRRSDEQIRPRQQALF
jgi:hypothetical protein